MTWTPLESTSTEHQSLLWGSWSLVQPLYLRPKWMNGKIHFSGKKEIYKIPLNVILTFKILFFTICRVNFPKSCFDLSSWDSKQRPLRIFFFTNELKLLANNFDCLNYKKFWFGNNSKNVSTKSRSKTLIRQTWVNQVQKNFDTESKAIITNYLIMTLLPRSMPFKAMKLSSFYIFLVDAKESIFMTIRIKRHS